MNDATMVIQGVYFVSQALLQIPWVAAVWYTDRWLSRFEEREYLGRK